jgi:hypothetical protein
MAIAIAVASVGLSPAAAAAAGTQFTSYTDHSGAILQGNWQSCREPDGQYGERVYDNTLPGIGPFELHMGPYHEFALFRGTQEAHQEHASPANLLRPYNLEVSSNRAGRKWVVAGLVLEVSLGGGSEGDCESWFVSLKRAGPSSSE